jgi:hypothetical protein
MTASVNALRRFLLAFVALASGSTVAVAEPATPEAAVAALWRALSHGPGEGADKRALEALFDPSAQVYGVAEKDGERVLVRRSAAEFIARHVQPDALPFLEREVHREVRHYGAFAEVFATVESRTAGVDSAATFTGINSVHLYEQDGRWRIIGLYYHLERPGRPFPEQWRGAKKS